jgi:hypothetical protein
MQAKKKKKLISRMCVAKWVDRSTLMKISPWRHVDIGILQERCS